MKLEFQPDLSPEGDDNCIVTAQSKSTVFSILDFGTNFCNINNLYCSETGCRPFKTLTYTSVVGTCSEKPPLTVCNTI